MNDQITWQSLATVAGATVGAGLVVQFIRQFATIAAATARKLAAASGFLIVEAVTIIDTVRVGATWYDWTITIALAAFVGMSAGLGASKAYEIAKDGISHSTTTVT